MTTTTLSHIILMGLRGSGKTTIGSLLAKRTSRAFVDLDDRTTALLGGKGVGEAFRRAGEAAFRTAEAAALAALVKERHAVIALGGGTPGAPGAAELLRARRAAGDVVVYLRASAEALRTRLALTDPAMRPSLTGKGMLEEIEVVMAKRDAMYASLASVSLDTSAMQPQQAAEWIENWLKDRPQAAKEPARS